MATYKLISQPQLEPVTLTQAKAHLRVSDTETYDDVYITGLITSARMAVENATWRALVSQQWQLVLDYSEVNKTSGYYNSNLRLYGNQTQIIELEKCPLISVDSIQYYDADNALRTLDASKYQVDLIKEPARILILDGPQCYNKLNTFIISFTGGYSRTFANSVTCTSVDITTNVFTKAAHGLRNSNIINFTDLGSVTGINMATDYYIINRTDNTFKISATLNGSTVDITGANTTAPTYQNQQILSVPQPIINAMLLLISDMYTYRESMAMGQVYTLPEYINNLLNPYKLNWHVPQ